MDKNKIEGITESYPLFYPKKYQKNINGNLITVDLHWSKIIIIFDILLTKRTKKELYIKVIGIKNCALIPPEFSNKIYVDVIESLFENEKVEEPINKDSNEYVFDNEKVLKFMLDNLSLIYTDFRRFYNIILDDTEISMQEFLDLLRGLPVESNFVSKYKLNLKAKKFNDPVKVEIRTANMINAMYDQAKNRENQMAVKKKLLIEKQKAVIKNGN